MEEEYPVCITVTRLEFAILLEIIVALLLTTVKCQTSKSKSNVLFFKLLFSPSMGGMLNFAILLIAAAVV
jgi:hypothetical protein